MAPEALLRLPHVCSRTGISRPSIYCLIKDGKFPKPVKLGPRMSAWPSRDVDCFVAAKIRGCSDAELRLIVKQLEDARRNRRADEGASAAA